MILKMQHVIMTSSNGNIFRVTGPLCGEFTGHRWIPHTKASDAELWCFLRSAPWINCWANNRGAGDLRRHRVHYDVIIMVSKMYEYFTMQNVAIFLPNDKTPVKAHKLPELAWWYWRQQISSIFWYQWLGQKNYHYWSIFDRCLPVSLWTFQGLNPKITMTAHMLPVTTRL